MPALAGGIVRWPRNSFGWAGSEGDLVAADHAVAIQVSPDDRRRGPEAAEGISRDERLLSA
jgi:hypothetical protein